MQLDLMRQAAQEVMRQSALPKPAVPQGAVWASVRDDPDKLLGYVQARTGYSGDALLKEVMAYSAAMKERYG